MGGADYLTGDGQRGPAGCDTADLFARVLAPLAPGARRGLARLETDEGLAGLSRLDAESLIALAGLGPRSARRLVAAFELGRAVERGGRRRGAALSSPAEVYRLLAPELRGLDKETFHVLLLDTRHRLRGRQRVSEGTLTASLVHPREVFGPALSRGAAAVVVVHNHPSGDPEPSAEDEAVTRRLLDAGRLLGIPLLDHVVLGEGAWVSLRQRMDFS